MKSDELRLYDFGLLFLIIFCASSAAFALIALGIFLGGSVVATVIAFAIWLSDAFCAVYFVVFFVMRPVRLCRDGVRKRGKFIPLEVAKFKEIHDLRIKEKRIVFYDKTKELPQYGTKEFKRETITVQSVKGYMEKIRRYYGGR